jgi:hypothetical protein
MRLPTRPWWEEWEHMLAEANPPQARQRSQDLLLLAKTLTQLGQQTQLARGRWGRRRRR